MRVRVGLLVVSLLAGCGTVGPLRSPGAGRHYERDPIHAAATHSGARAADPGIQAALEGALAANGFKDAGVVLRDLDTGKAAGVQETTVFRSASIIKLAVMAETRREVAEEGLDPGKVVTIAKRNYTDTWKPVLRVGDPVTVAHLVELMITKSDNIATNTLVDLCTRQKINAFMAKLGLAEIQFHHKLSGGSIPVQDPDYDGGRNQITPAAVATLLERIARGTLISAPESALMKDILGRQEDNDKIPSGLPPGAKVYHKTGETSAVTHDAAIVESQGHRYLLVMLANRAPGTHTYRAFGLVAGVVDGALRGSKL